MILSVLALRSVVSQCPQRWCVSNNIMILKYYGEDTACLDSRSQAFGSCYAWGFYHA